MLPQKQGATQPPTQPTRLCLLVAQINEPTLVTAHKGCTGNMSMFLILCIFFLFLFLKHLSIKVTRVRHVNRVFPLLKKVEIFFRSGIFVFQFQVLFSCTYLGISVLLKEIKGKR